MDLLNDLSKIVTARVSVPVSTPNTAPLILKITSQLPILDSLQIFLYSAAGAVTPIETGWKVGSGGRDIIPAFGSSDSLVGETYAPVFDGASINLENLNYQLDGPPYELEFKFYNLDAAAIAYYFVFVKLAPKIYLVNAPIPADVGAGSNLDNSSVVLNVEDVK